MATSINSKSLLILALYAYACDRDPRKIALPALNFLSNGTGNGFCIEHVTVTVDSCKSVATAASGRVARAWLSAAKIQSR